MDINYNANPKFVALELAQKEVAAKYQLLQAELTNIHQQKNTIMKDWWKNNTDKFNLFDKNDFIKLGTAAWDNGTGNTVITEYFNKVIKEAGISNVVSHLGHHPFNTAKTVKSLPAFNVNMQSYFSNELLEKAADFLEKVNSAGKAWYPEYGFTVTGVQDEDSDGGSLWMQAQRSSHTVVYSGYDKETLFLIGENTLKVLKKLREQAGE